MSRVTRNNSSGPLQSMPCGPSRKRKGPLVIEEENVPIAEEEGAATGYKESGELGAATQGIGEFNIPIVNRQDKSSSAPPPRPPKRARVVAPEVPGDDVTEVTSTGKAAELVTKPDKRRSPVGVPRPRRSPRKSLLRDTVAGRAQKTAGKPRSSVLNNRNRSSLALMEAGEKGLTEETERRIEEGIPSEDEEGGGARLSASHDPLQLEEKQPTNRRTTLLSLRTEQVPSSSGEDDGDLLPDDRLQESPEKVVEELMNNVVTSAISQLDRIEGEVEGPESEGTGVGPNPRDDEDVDEAVRHQLSTEANERENHEVEIRPESLASGEDDSQCEMSLATAFKSKLEQSHKVLQTFKEHLKAATDTIDLLMELRIGVDCRSGYTPVLQEIVRKLAEEERPDDGALEELADFASDINSIVSGTRDAHRRVKSLLEDLNAGIISGTSSARTIEALLEKQGFKEKAPPDGINWKRINRNLVARENEALALEKPKPTEPQTPRRSARSNSSRYRTQGVPPTPEARPPPPPPAIPSKRLHENEDDDSPQVREDRAWSSLELKALFRRLAQVQKAEPGKIIVLDSRSGYPRTKEEILTKAKEIKEDMVRSGRAGSLKPIWDDI
ncbi:hypothetical protein C7212DRAFT_353333 [Tuber magnatum]|uniref:Uncharacterized protein n=1 Tax=Tuber magnatum TaxID=42249 RepID=A0A317SIE2_9PEZI|nr:hypothetical protein C7212DRAFT_353333 [Tuber magnatum]